MKKTNAFLRGYFVDMIHATPTKKFADKILTLM